MPLELPEKLKRLVNIAQYARGTRETARLALNCFDLTSLSGNETKEEIFDLCDVAKHNKLATIFIYPDQIENAKKALRDSPVIIGTPVNFPTGKFRTLSEDRATASTIIEDVEIALKRGAKQIDMVFPLELFRNGSLREVKEQLRACRKACGPDITMKVIFETAAYNDALELRKACKLAIGQGVDCLKTSTGKHPAGGATLEAAAILMDEAQRAPYLVGCKVSGGIRTNDDCAKYITVCRGIRGSDSIRPEFFRIGASGLINDLVSSLGTVSQLNQPASGAPNYVY